MLVGYYLYRIIGIFVPLATSLTLLFAGFDATTRISSLVSPQIGVLFWLGMLPAMLPYTIPCALMCSLQFSTIQTIQSGEYAVLISMQSAKRAFLAAQCLVLVGIAALYAPVVFYIAPRSYGYAKHLLTEAFRKKISELAPGQLHQFSQKSALYYRCRGEAHALQEVMFSRPIDKDKKLCAITARRCWTHRALIIFTDGVGTISGQKGMDAHFDELIIDPLVLFPVHMEQVPSKFLSLQQLMHTSNPCNLLEFNRRFAALFWLVVLAFCGLFTACATQWSNNRLFLALAWAGGLFITFYSGLNAAASFSHYPQLGILLLYGLPLLVLGLVLTVTAKYY